MNTQLYDLLGIDKNQELKALLDALEDKQFEYLERSETVSDEKRKKEIEDILHQVEKEISAVKDQIKSISSGVILDTASSDEKKSPVKEAPKKQEAVKPAVEKKEQVANKVDEIKQKAAEKKAKEEEKKKQEAQKKAANNQAAQNAQNNQNGAKANNSQAQNAANAQAQAQAQAKAFAQRAVQPLLCFSGRSAEIDKGLQSYGDADYTTAFNIFKGLSEQGDSAAQYILSTMYNSGTGTKRDLARGEFWVEKSAKSGEPAGQALFGATLLRGSDINRYREGFNYLKKAADSGDSNAMVDYVNFCISGKGIKKEVGNAIGYCDKLKTLTNDSFNKKKYDDAKVTLKGIKKNSVSKTPTGPTVKKKIHWGRIIAGIIVVLFIIAMLEDEIDFAARRKAKEADPIASQTLLINVSKGNVRMGAGKDNKVIYQVFDGDECTPTGETAEDAEGHIWYEIYLDDNSGETGWISEEISELVE